MHLTLVTDDGSPSTQYESLYDWLTAEPDLRPLVKLEKRPPAPGELGWATEALTIAVGAGGALSVLAGALGAWLFQVRNRGVHIEIHEKRNGDRSIVLDARNTKTSEVERMLRSLTDGTIE